MAAVAQGAEVRGGQWDALAGSARVWVYAATRCLRDEEVVELSSALDAFTGQWAAHQVPLKAGWLLWGNRVLVIGVDEAVHPASGCSIDAMTHALKAIGAQLQVDWFERMQVLYTDEQGGWAEAPMHAFWALRKAGRVSDGDLVVNALVKTKSDWTHSGIQPFGKSWHAAMWR